MHGKWQKGDKKNEEVKKQLKLPEEDRETDVTKDTNH